MRVSVSRPGELGRNELTRWRALQEEVPEWANPFLAPEFAIAVGHARPEARVGVLEAGSRIVGFFPFEMHSFGVGLPMGAGISDCQALIHEPGLIVRPRDLLRRCGLDVWSFDHLLASQQPFSTRTASRTASPVIDLRAGFEAYMDADGRRDSRTLKDLSRGERRVERQIGPLHFSFEIDDPKALQTLMSWKSARYVSTGGEDRFATDGSHQFASGWVTQVVEELAATEGPGLKGTLSTLRAGERLLAVDFSLRSASVFGGWFMASDRSCRRASPGLIMIMRLIRAAAEAGLRQFDLGKGAEPFKSRLKTGEVPLMEGHVRRWTPEATLWRLQASQDPYLQRMKSTLQIRRRAAWSRRRIEAVRTAACAVSQGRVGVADRRKRGDPA